MIAYGRKKTKTHVAGHQNCGICHPVQKNKSVRARREGKKETHNAIGTPINVED